MLVKHAQLLTCELHSFNTTAQFNESKETKFITNFRYRIYVEQIGEVHFHSDLVCPLGCDRARSSEWAQCQQPTVCDSLCSKDLGLRIRAGCGY